MRDAVLRAIRAVDGLVLDRLFQPLIEAFGRWEGARFRFAQSAVDLGAGLCIAFAIETLIRSHHPLDDVPVVTFQLVLDLVALTGSRRSIQLARRIEELSSRVGSPTRNREIHRRSRGLTVQVWALSYLITGAVLLAPSGFTISPMAFAILVFPLVGVISVFFLSCDEARPRRASMSVRRPVAQGD